MITLADQPVVVDYQGELEQYLSLRYPPEHMPFHHTAFELDALEAVGVSAMPRWPQLPRIQVGEFLEPQGASRWSRSLQVVGQAQLTNIMQAAWGITWDGNDPLPTGARVSNDIELKYQLTDDSTYQVIEHLHLLPPIQLDGFKDPRQLWLLPLVDWRYELNQFHATLGDVKSDTTWANLITMVENALNTFTGGGWTIGYSAIEAEYLQPDPEFFSQPYLPLGVILDLLAQSIGRRVVFGYTGAEVYLQTATQAQSSLSSVLGGMPADPMLGGEIPFGPRAERFYLKMRGLYDHWPEDKLSQSAEAVPTSDNTDKRPAVPSTLFLQRYGGQEDPVSRGNANDLITKLADQWVAWDRHAYDVTYAGSPAAILSFKQVGFQDFFHVAIDSSSQDPALVTRTRSLPLDSRPRVNLCQSADLYVHPSQMITFSTITLGKGTITDNDKGKTNYDGTPKEVDVVNHANAPANDNLEPSGAVYRLEQGWTLTGGKLNCQDLCDCEPLALLNPADCQEPNRTCCRDDCVFQGDGITGLVYNDPDGQYGDGVGNWVQIGDSQFCPQTAQGCDSGVITECGWRIPVRGPNGTEWKEDPNNPDAAWGARVFYLGNGQYRFEHSDVVPYTNPGAVTFGCTDSVTLERTGMPSMTASFGVAGTICPICCGVNDNCEYQPNAVTNLACVIDGTTYNQTQTSTYEESLPCAFRVPTSGGDVVVFYEAGQWIVSDLKGGGLENVGFNTCAGNVAVAAGLYFPGSTGSGSFDLTGLTCPVPAQLAKIDQDLVTGHGCALADIDGLLRYWERRGQPRRYDELARLLYRSLQRQGTENAKAYSQELVEQLIRKVYGK